ncbi:MAG: glycosyltransferase family 2 protein [Flavobacterium sp.]|nr:glycosyltransferase family 2 protein [Flavobacterium sp.]
MPSNPKISVLMPVYNCELYVKEAVQSILNQTFTDFELLIIDDASTDKTVNIIKEFNDSRINLIEKQINSGYTESLNYGLSIANGTYIARMDGDDISLAERFEKQLAFLDTNPDVILCGSWYSIINSDDVIALPENHEAIKIGLLQNCCIGHPTVMIRSNSLNENDIKYNPEKEPAEDYDLWVRLLSIGKLHNLPEVLLNYRIHNVQVSQKRSEQQQASSLTTKFNLLGKLNLNYNDAEYKILIKIFRSEKLDAFDEVLTFLELKPKMANANQFFESKDFEQYLNSVENKLLKGYFFKRNRFLPVVFLQYQKIKRRWQFRLTYNDSFKFFIKSFIFYKNKQQ